jgi:hypothetical protein
MFAYCGNNPICFSDPSGYARKYFPICLEFEDENNEDAYQDPIYAGTFSLGGAGSVGVGPWIWGAQVFFTMDANGYVALQWGLYSGMSGGPNSDKFSASIMPFVMGTNAPGYMALEGPGIQMGGTIPPYSLDYVGIMDSGAENIVYHGLALGLYATSPDVHITGGYTGTFFAVVFDWELYHQITSY